MSSWRYVSTGFGPTSSAVGMFEPVTITRSAVASAAAAAGAAGALGAATTWAMVTLSGRMFPYGSACVARVACATALDTNTRASPAMKRKVELRYFGLGMGFRGLADGV